MKVSDPVRIDVDPYPGRPICGYVEAILPAAGAEFALIPPDNATCSGWWIGARTNAEADAAGALAHRRKREVRGVVANDTPRSVRLVILRSLYTRE